MRARRRPVTRAGSRLFAIYAVASLVPVLALGFVLYRENRREGLDRALAQGRAQAAVIEQMAVAPVLSKRDLDAGLRPPELRRLGTATDLASFSGSVLRMRLRTFDGRVMFSDDGLADGGIDPADPQFRAAANGDRVAALVPDPTGGGGQVIRVLQTIVPNASGRATGVLELYLPYRTIAARVDAQLHRTTLRLGGVLAGLYLVLALISWSTTLRLRRHAAEREHQALHDPLTGLANRELFRQRAERAVRDGERPGAIALVDLDRFKQVNDTLGHQAGDELLRIVARRLQEAARTDDLVARLGGDEFGLVLPGVADGEHALELLGRLRAELARPLVLEGVPIDLEACAGAALYPEHGTTVEALLRHADSAMYQGKRGAARVVVHTAGAPEHRAPGLLLQGELRRALDGDELTLHYQPQVKLATGAMPGVEALLRWKHPDRGLLAPGAFLPAVEGSGLIEPLTEWVLRRALSDRAQWLAAGADWNVSVNVSARNLEAPDFAERVIALLAATGTPASGLWIEVTETALAADTDRATRTLEALAAAGVGISIDDFGSGYTSLGGLRTLPVGEVKIDRAFVLGLAGCEQDRSIVRSIVDLGHGLGCAVTAEGVEDAETADWLREAGCDYAQGYHFARPAPWGELLGVEARA